MSDELDAPAPEAPASDAPDMPPGPEPAAPARRRRGRMLWSWAGRRPRITAITACVVVAGAVAGTGLATMPSPPPGPQYASLPAQPCAMISLADRARYLPGATGSPLSIPGSSQARIGTCKWSARGGGEDTTLLIQAVVFGSPAGVHAAQASYRSTLSGLKCRCPRVTARARTVIGQGDQAAEVFVVPGPDADFGSTPNASNPGTTLLVRSSNAIIFLGLDTTAAGTGAFLASPPSAMQRAGLMAMARDALDVLAHPAAVRRSAIAPLTSEAHYAGRPDPCKMISAATLTRYAPGAVLSPEGAPSSGATQDSECDWNSDSTSITVRLKRYPGPASALQEFSTGTQAVGVALSGARWIPDLAELAAGTFSFDPALDSAELFLWSGNVYLDYSYTLSGASRLDHSAPLAAVIAMARDGVAALARPAVSAYGQGPRYASPHDACAMIKKSTLARYTPGAIADPASGNNGTTDSSICGLGSGSVSIVLIITIQSDADNGQGEFESDVQYARENHDDTKVTGMRPVRGVGSQADAIFETFTGSPSVELLVWSGNANVEVSCTDLGFGPPLSRAGKLAAAIAIARDVLAALPRA